MKNPDFTSEDLGSRALGLSAVDFDGDGSHKDIFIGTLIANQPSAQAMGEISHYRYNGSSFDKVGAIEVDLGMWGLKVFDLEDDGDFELIASSANGHFYIYSLASEEIGELIYRSEFIAPALGAYNSIVTTHIADTSYISLGSSQGVHTFSIP